MTTLRGPITTIEVFWHPVRSGQGTTRDSRGNIYTTHRGFPASPPDATRSGQAGNLETAEKDQEGLRRTEQDQEALRRANKDCEQRIAKDLRDRVDSLIFRRFHRHGKAASPPRRASLVVTPGEVSEWLKEHAWKVCIRKRIEGSNPSLSAIFIYNSIG